MESDALISTMLNAVDAEQSRATMETDRASDRRCDWWNLMEFISSYVQCCCSWFTLVSKFLGSSDRGGMASWHVAFLGRWFCCADFWNRCDADGVNTLICSVLLFMVNFHLANFIGGYKLRLVEMVRCDADASPCGSWWTRPWLRVQSWWEDLCWKPWLKLFIHLTLTKSD